jgi:hypothetical protein
MRTDEHGHEPEHKDPLTEMGYELADVEYKGLAKSVGMFFVFVIFCGAAGMAIFIFGFVGWDKFWSGGSTTTAPFARHLPAEPNPLLQTDETAKTDIVLLRRRENAILDGPVTYTDSTKKTIRIPIKEAIDLYSRKNSRGEAASIGETLDEAPELNPAKVSGGAPIKP